MNYESPIEIIVNEMKAQMDNTILQAVQNVGVVVDKDKLIKALRYDRDQYRKGYSDRDADIVRCKECKHRDPEDHKCDNGHTIQWQLPRPDDWFCADGERRD